MKKVLSLLFSFLLIFSFTSNAFAIDLDASIGSDGSINANQADNGTKQINSKTEGALSDKSVPSLLNSAISIVLGLATLVSLGFVIYGGILWATSQGDPKKTGQAKKYFTVGFISVAIILFAYVISSFLIKQITGTIYQENGTAVGCTTDTDCATDRICTDSKCVLCGEAICPR